jgi:aspartate racemase
VLAIVVFSLIACGCAMTNAAGSNRSAGTTPAPNVTLSGAGPGEIKTIGLIGGVSWVSSAEYYRIMNEKVQKDMGGLHSAQVLMFSIQFSECSKQERLADKGDWDPLDRTKLDAARRLKNGGADFVIIGSNSLNSRMVDIEANDGIPVLRITDATGAAVKKSGITKVALPATTFTMEQDFYRDALEEKYGLVVVATMGRSGRISTQ